MSSPFEVSVTSEASVSEAYFTFGAVSSRSANHDTQNACIPTGDLCVSRDETLIIEWTIDNFLSLLGDVKDCSSPRFTFSSCTWYLNLRPLRGCEEWIALYLRSIDCKPSQIIVFELGIKKQEEVFCLRQKFIREFRGKAKYGIVYFLRRSELAEKKDEISNSESLTIFCKLEKPGGKKKEFAPFLMELFAAEKHSDLTIVVKGQEFRTHKLVLAASSEVFSAMFDHEMSENNSGVVNIEDCEPESFKDFLNFLYAGRTNITDSNVVQLYTIGHKYCVEELIVSCVGFIMRNLSVDNICDVATLGQQYFDSHVISRCSEFFEDNVKKILLSPQWKSLMEENFRVAYKLLEYIANRITVQKCTCSNCEYSLPLHDSVH